MRRREFLKASAVVAGVGFLGGRGCTPAAEAAPVQAPPPGQEGTTMTIRDYLSREARRITDRALSQYQTRLPGAGGCRKSAAASWR